MALPPRAFAPAASLAAACLLAVLGAAGIAGAAGAWKGRQPVRMREARDPQAPPGAASSGTAPFGPASGEAAPFEGRRELALERKPEGLCTGDFDGDGTPDVAVTLLAPGSLLVWYSSAAGLGHGRAIFPCGDFPLAPVALPAGSFGARGTECRLAIASRAERSLELAAPDCRSFALERTPRALAAGRARAGAVVAVACEGRRLELLRDGAAAPERLPLSGDMPRCALVLEELDAVLVGFQDTAAVDAISLGGEAPAGTRLFSLPLAGLPRALAVLDADGDGERELAIAAGDHEIVLYGLDAPGGARGLASAGEPRIWRADAIPTALGVGDVDRDGRDDLAVVNEFSQSLQWLTRLSPAGPGTSRSFYVGQTPAGIALVDVDRDGALDAVLTNRDPQGFSVVRGDGAGSLFIGANLPLDDFPMAMAARPGETDGALRLVALNAKTNSVSSVVRAPDAEGGGLRVLSGVPCGAEPRAPRIAELDGRPGLDLLFLAAGHGGADLCLFGGDEHGALAPARLLPLGFAASDLALVDLDRDGAPEIALADPSGGRVLLCEHSLVFADNAALAAAASLAVASVPTRLAPIELDGDPAPELVCVLASPGARVGIALLDARRDGAGALELVELGFTPLAAAPLEAAAADLDGDGREDLAVLATRAHDSPVGAWYALVRDGGVTFRAEPPIATGLLPRALAAGDVDGDGRAEVFVSIQTTTLVQTWRSQGRDRSESGTGQTPLEWRALDSLGAGRGPLDLVLSDADGDGIVDLCVSNAFSNDVSVLRGTRR